MSRRIRRTAVNFGTLSAIKRGAPSPFADLYYSALELRWPSFIAIVAGIFLSINILFGLLYAALPGTIANARPGSFLDGFFFSVETLATVGYGNMAPVRYAAHAAATVEIFVGLLLTATLTGLTFARFARPRQSIMFSNVAVLGNLDGREALMVRVVSLRTRPIADASAQMAFVEQVNFADGRSFRQVVDLPLVRPHNPMLSLSWTISHLVESGSRIGEALRKGENVRLMVTVGGTDTLLASPTFGGRFYRTSEIMIDHDFVDIIHDSDEGVIEVDLTKFHLTQPRVPQSGPGAALE
jgi:inward rectifier potassium channel